MEQNPYRAPDTLPPTGGPTPSPRTRFWVACLCAFLAAPALIIVATRYRQLTSLAFAGMALGWIGAIVWVQLAHMQLPGRDFGSLRGFVVSIGLTIGLAAFFVLGIVATNLLLASFR